MDRDFFDSTLGYDWDMDKTFPIDRSLDPIKIAGYLSMLEEPDRSFVQELIAKTTYVPYQEFKLALLESFDSFHKHIGQTPFYIMLPSSKIGSEHWLTALLWSQLREMNIRGIIDDASTLPIMGMKEILIIDDAIYSGNNMLGSMDGFTYNLSLTTRREQCEIGKHFHFHVVVPFVSKGGKSLIEKVCEELNTQCSMYGRKYVSDLPDVIDLKKYYSAEMKRMRDTLREKFGIEVIVVPPLYFGHKVAGTMSTFSSIYQQGLLPDGTKYGSLFKVDPSRDKIEELAKLHKV